jgi:hypothetical protein
MGYDMLVTLLGTGKQRRRSMSKITWTGSNNSSYLNGSRSAKTVIGAVRAAISYGNYELYGEGKLTIFDDGQPIRVYEAGLLAGTSKCDWRRTDRGV